MPSCNPNEVIWSLRKKVVVTQIPAVRPARIPIVVALFQYIAAKTVGANWQMIP